MPEFPKLKKALIVATKGLPCTMKSEIARRIGYWSKSRVLYIDHFLASLSLEKGYTCELLPSPDEADRLNRLSFDALCDAASDNLRWGADHKFTVDMCVVVKSRLCSLFELDRLIQLGREHGLDILIIEFEMKNKHRIGND